MKSLLSMGAAAALVIAGSTYAGDYGGHYGGDCIECEETLEIDLVGFVDCECDIQFLTPLAFSALTLEENTLHVADGLLNVDCNTDEPLVIELERVNVDGLQRVGGMELVDYEVEIDGVVVPFNMEVPFDGSAPVGVRILEDALVAGTYEGTLFVTIRND